MSEALHDEVKVKAMHHGAVEERRRLTCTWQLQEQGTAAAGKRKGRGKQM